MKSSEGPEEPALIAELEARLGEPGIRLMRIQPNCVSKAYRAMRSDGSAFFTKWSRIDRADMEEWNKAARKARRIMSTPLSLSRSDVQRQTPEAEIINT